MDLCTVIGAACGPYTELSTTSGRHRANGKCNSNILNFDTRWMCHLTF